MTMSRFRPCFETTRATSLLAIVVAAFVLASTAGCAYKPIEPWVKPYERERLADPVMKTSLNELPGRQQDHIYTVREGSRGATGVQGGGCGCN
jgi:hypothetical protein